MKAERKIQASHHKAYRHMRRLGVSQAPDMWDIIHFINSQFKNKELAENINNIYYDRKV